MALNVWSNFVKCVWHIDNWQTDRRNSALIIRDNKVPWKKNIYILFSANDHNNDDRWWQTFADVEMSHAS